MQETNCDRGRSGDCMSMDGFHKCIQMDIQRRLGCRYAVFAENVPKNNDVQRKSLIIREQGSCLGQIIYLDAYYQQYSQRGCLTEIEDEILKIYEQSRKDCRVDASFISDWQKVKDKITYKLVNYERNRELLKDIPHCRFLDLAVVFQCIVEITEDGIASFLIHDSNLRHWGRRQEDLYQKAVWNTPRLMGYQFEELNHFLLEDGYEASEAYILTNRCLLNGAGCILYKGVLQSIAEQWESDLCIIPSSINEVILMPLGKVPSYERLSKMIREINVKFLKPEEILSDHMYKYIKAMGQITM